MLFNDANVYHYHVHILINDAVVSKDLDHGLVEPSMEQPHPH